MNTEREFELITTIRALIYMQHFDEASTLLRRLTKLAETGGRLGTMIELLILQSLIYAHQGRREAKDAMVQALRLAQADGYVRLCQTKGVR